MENAGLLEELNDILSTGIKYITVCECESCGCKHEMITPLSLEKPINDFNGYFICPTNNIKIEYKLQACLLQKNESPASLIVQIIQRISYGKGKG